MSTKLRPVAPAEQGSPNTDANPIRNRLAGRYAKMDARFPASLDLCASVLDALHSELAGHASEVRGTQSAVKFRESLRGQGSPSLAVLCRLATSPHPAAARAVDRALAVLARARGYVLAPEAPAGSGVLAAVANVSRSYGATLAGVAEDIADGRIDDIDQRRVEIMRMKVELAKLESEVELSAALRPSGPVEHRAVARG